MRLGTNICHVSGHSWKGFQVQRSKVKVIVRPNALCSGGTTVWHRGWLVFSCAEYKCPFLFTYLLNYSALLGIVLKFGERRSFLCAGPTQ